MALGVSTSPGAFAADAINAGSGVIREHWRSPASLRLGSPDGAISRVARTRGNGTDPVARWERLFQVVVAPTGQAVRFFAATEGEGSAWITRAEAKDLIEFLTDWLTRTEPD